MLLICLMYSSFPEELLPNETYCIKNIKSTAFFIWVQTQNPRNYESTNLQFLIKPREVMPTKKSTFTVIILVCHEDH